MNIHLSAVSVGWQPIIHTANFSMAHHVSGSQTCIGHTLVVVRSPDPWTRWRTWGPHQEYNCMFMQCFHLATDPSHSPLAVAGSAREASMWDGVIVNMNVCVPHMYVLCGNVIDVKQNHIWHMHLKNYWLHNKSLLPKWAAKLECHQNCNW